MATDTHPHTCPFKPGGRAAELCAASCGFKICKGRNEGGVAELLARVLGAEEIPEQRWPRDPRPLEPRAQLLRGRLRLVETIKFADREEPLL